MKRLFAATITVLALGAGPASAAFKTGTYTGKTDHKGPVSFKVTSSKLSKLRIGVVFLCSDGDKFQTTLKGFPAQNVVNGRYDADFTGSGGASAYTHKGKITRRKVGRHYVSTAKGTFTGVRHYNTNDELDPNGTVRCDTGTLTYTIRK